jgi:hypothetical protein
MPQPVDVLAALGDDELVGALRAGDASTVTPFLKRFFGLACNITTRYTPNAEVMAWDALSDLALELPGDEPSHVSRCERRKVRQQRGRARNAPPGLPDAITARADDVGYRFLDTATNRGRAAYRTRDGEEAHSATQATRADARRVTLPTVVLVERLETMNVLLVRAAELLLEHQRHQGAKTDVAAD